MGGVQKKTEVYRGCAKFFTKCRGVYEKKLVKSMGEGGCSKKGNIQGVSKKITAGSQVLHWP